jgi:hypothetical protein
MYREPFHAKACGGRPRRLSRLGNLVRRRLSGTESLRRELQWRTGGTVVAGLEILLDRAGWKLWPAEERTLDALTEGVVQGTTAEILAVGTRACRPNP